MYRLTSIRSKLFALFLVAGVIPIIAVSLISYANSLRAVEDMVGNRTARFAQTVRDDLSRKLEKRLADRILWVNQPVQDFLRTRAYADPEAYEQAQDELLQYLPQLLKSYEGFYDGLLLADLGGKPILRFRSSVGVEESWTTSITRTEMLIAEGPGSAYPDEIPPPPPSPETRTGSLTLVQIPGRTEQPGPPRAFRAENLARGISDEDRAAARLGARLDAGEVRAITSIPQDGGRRTIRLLRGVNDAADSTRRLGVMVADLRSDYLFPDNLPAERFGVHGEILVVDDQTDEILFHSRPERIGKHLRQIDPGLAGAFGEETEPGSALWRETRGPDGDRLAVGYRVAGVPWTVIAAAVPREFQGEAQRAGVYNLLIASAALLLAGVVLFAASGRISNSIKTVTAGARRIAAGRLDHTIRVRTHDEIQILADAFNQMTRSLSESIAMRERAARELEEMNRTLEDRVRERTRALEELNAALNEANRELKELDRLKSNFLATVSHEFKTPLTSIKAFAEILLDETQGAGGTGEVTRFLGIIHSESERLGRLIKNLLSLSQIESGRITWVFSEFAIEHVLGAALDGLLPAFKEKGVRVVQDIACPGARVLADHDRVQEVVTNLLENALKFTEREGTITVSCRATEEPGAGEAVQVTILDSGPGIAPDKHETIFERFSQVDPGDTRAKGGTGLGLAICREIVEHHRGRIWVESDPGQGAAFHFTLPLAADRPEPGGSCG